MSSTVKTVACPLCGRPYKFYMFYAGDQSACPRCVAEAEENEKIIFSRSEFFKTLKENK